MRQTNYIHMYIYTCLCLCVFVYTPSAMNTQKPTFADSISVKTVREQVGQLMCLLAHECSHLSIFH